MGLSRQRKTEIPPKAGILSRAAPRRVGGEWRSATRGVGGGPTTTIKRRGKPVTDSACRQAACERCGLPQASAEPALLCKFTVLLARAPHDRHITKIKKAVTLSMSVCRGAVMVVVGPCEHRRERWKNPAQAESQAPWNVAIGGFSGENAARKQARRPAPPRSP